MSKNKGAAAFFDEELFNPEADAQAEAEEIKKDIFTVSIKKQRETKSKRVQLLVKPSVYQAVSDIADEEGISVNELINIVLERIVENRMKGENKL